jgi:Flp pilus assembly pilin Flp
MAVASKKVNMKRTIERAIHDGEGQDLIEYALLSALLAVVCITGILELTRIMAFLTAVAEALGNAI